MRDRNIIGNPKRSRFSFGYSNGFGEFGGIDLMVTILFLVVIGLVFAFSSLGVAMLVTVCLVMIGLLMLKQYGNEKSYDLLINLIKSLGEFKQLKKVSTDKEEVVFRVKGGFNLNLMDEAEINEVVSNFNHFINLYEGNGKIVKLNNGFDMDSVQKKFLEQAMKENNSDEVKRLQVIFSQYLDQLNEVELNNEFYFVFEKPKASQLEMIKQGQFGLELEVVSQERGNDLREVFFNGEIKMNKIVSGEEKIVGKAKFRREVNWLGLGKIFDDERVSFVLEINSLEMKEKDKALKSLNKQRVNYKTKNEIEEVAKEELNQANEAVMAEIILDKASLRMIDLGVVFIKDKASDANIETQWKEFVQENYYFSGFKLVKSIFKQKNSLEAMFYHGKNGVYPTIGETIANSYPFENQTYLDEDGVYLGTIEGRYPFIYDSGSKKDKSNWHTLLIGSSGSGKTTLMKYLVGSELATNKGRHIILDPHNEFGVLAEDDNKAKVFNLTEIKLNPLKFGRFDKNNGDKVLKEKILSLKEFFRLIYRQEVDSEFNKELQKLLLSFGEEFNRLKDEIIEGKEFRFSDLKINNELLNPLIKGIYKDFNQYETFSLKERLVVGEGKELGLMEETFRNSIIFLVMNRINEVIYANQEKQEQINLYLDEAGKFLRNEFLIKKLSPLFSEARKFRTKLTIATQNLTDLYNGDSKDVNLANIFANASNTFIGYLKNDQRKLLDELLQEGKGRELATNEHHHINQKQGHWLYLMDNTRLAFKSLYDEEINEIVGIE